MKLFDPDPGIRWLFCMTHPDDEISICAWVHRLTRAGAEVFMCWTHSKPEREAEARAVAELLGVHQGNLSFLNAPDRDTCDHMANLVPLMREVIEEARPDRIVCGAFEQGHLDHDATNWIVHHAWEGPVLEIPFYHTYCTRLQTLNRFADATGQDVIRLTPQEERFKLTVAKQFPSQNIWSVLWWYEVWQRTKLKPAQLSKSERLRLQTHVDFRKPNLPPKMSAKVSAHASWHRWLGAVDRAETQLEASTSEGVGVTR